MRREKRCGRGQMNARIDEKNGGLVGQDRAGRQRNRQRRAVLENT